MFAEKEILAELKGIRAILASWFPAWQDANVVPNTAAGLTLTIQGATPMATLALGTTDGAANVQYVDTSGAPDPGPNDDVTGEPIAPVVVSSDTGVVTVSTASPGATPGLWTAALTLVATGTTTISVAEVVNSDGSVADAPDGSALTLPSPVTLTVTPAPDSAAGLTLTITG